MSNNKTPKRNMFLHFIRFIVSDYFNNNIGPKMLVYSNYTPNLACLASLCKNGYEPPYQCQEAGFWCWCWVRAGVPVKKETRLAAPPGKSCSSGCETTGACQAPQREAACPAGSGAMTSEFRALPSEPGADLCRLRHNATLKNFDVIWLVGYVSASLCVFAGPWRHNLR